MDTSNTIEKLKKIFSRTKRDPGKLSISHKKDWTLVLIVFTTINIIVFIFGFYNFFQLRNETLFSLDRTTAPVDAFNKNTLEKTVEDYRNQEVLFEKRLNIRLKTIDPSQ